MMLSMRPQLLTSPCPIALLILLQLTLLPFCHSAQQWTCCTLRRINFTRLTPFLSSPLPQIFTIEQAQEDMLLIQTIDIKETTNLTVWNCNTSTKVNNFISIQCDIVNTTLISSPVVTIASIFSNFSADSSPTITITVNDLSDFGETTYWCREELTFPPNRIWNSILMCQANSTCEESSTANSSQECNSDTFTTNYTCISGYTSITNPGMCNNRNLLVQPPSCNSDTHSDISAGDPVCVGINITEGVFIFQNCFEVCASLDENCNSEGPDVKICDILDTINNLTSDERNSDFDAKDNFENLSIQELLLDAVEDLSRVLAKKFLLSGSTVSENYTRGNIFVGVRKLLVNDPNKENVRSFNKDVNGILEAELNIPSLYEAKKGAVTAVVAVVIVRNLGSYLDIITSSDDDTVSSIGTIMTINMFVTNNGSEQKRMMLMNNVRPKRNFRDSPVMLTLSNLSTGVIGCVSWNFSQRGWSPEGIDSELHVGGDEVSVRCNISHFSSFSILFSPTGQGGVERSIALNVVSYIGCGVSIVCLIVTILALIMFRNSLNKNLFLVHLNLSISLLVSLVIFVATVDPASSIHALCVVTTSFLHYFLLASFCWMLCEGILLYLMVVRVFGVAIMKWWFLLMTVNSFFTTKESIANGLEVKADLEE